MFLVLSASAGWAQAEHVWTDSENYGLRGAVKSVSTSVTFPNKDPRPVDQRKLVFPGGTADWAAFDKQGRRTQSPRNVSAQGYMDIATCSYPASGGKTCTDKAGVREESKSQQTTLPDGSKEIRYFNGDKFDSREVTRSDSAGRVTEFRTYDGEGRLISEQSTQFLSDSELSTWKVYNQASGRLVLHQQTRQPDDESRIERWAYDGEGNLVWHIALDTDGSVLSSWYKSGYVSEQSSSDSLGFCRPQLCVSYKFDEQGSGGMERTVQHYSGEDYQEPNSAEHFGFDGTLDAKAEFKYVRDSHENWIIRSLFIWDQQTNRMVETERTSRTIEYYR